MTYKPIDEILVEQVSQTFKALSDPTRIKILHLLFQKECSVGEMANQLEMQQSTISHQLKYLKQLHLVKNRRVKTMYYYSPDDDHVMNLLDQTIEHTKIHEGGGKMGHHEQNHGHAHHHTDNVRVLFWSFLAIFTFMIVEAVGGFLTNSLALMSDAGHMLSDAAALGLSLLAFKIGERKATKDKTYGFRRFEIIAAFINGVTLIVISLYILYEAFHRFFDPPNVSANMMIIACIGLVVNIGVAWMLMRGDSQDNLNIRSALLHVFGDLLGSVGAIIAGLLILLFNWNIADPIASVVVAILILYSGIHITKDAVHILMEGKPGNVNVADLKQALSELDGVENVHDLHVWSITSELPMMSCHLVVNETVDRDHLLLTANELIKNNFQVSHCTLQIEGVNTTIQQDCNYCH